MELETFFSVGEELRIFGLSILLGIPMGIVFDFFRALRSVFRHNAVLVFVEDCMFFIICGIMLLCFAAVFARFEIRFYFVAGSFAGFAIFCLTVGRFVMRAIRKIVLACRFLFGKIKKCFVKTSQKAAEKIGQKGEKVFTPQKTCHGLLKSDGQMIYNYRTAFFHGLFGSGGRLKNSAGGGNSFGKEVKNKKNRKKLSC